MRLVRGLPNARVVLVNIFGGITRTTDVAEGLRDVLSEEPMAPVFARISGAEEEEAHALLAGVWHLGLRHRAGGRPRRGRGGPRLDLRVSRRRTSRSSSRGSRGGTAASTPG